MSRLEMLTPQNCILVLVDYQPAMYQGIQSHDRNVTFHNSQVLAKAAGLWTDACVMFPSLDLMKAGFEVYVPADACGDVSPEAHDQAMDRLGKSGAVPQ